MYCRNFRDFKQGTQVSGRDACFEASLPEDIQLNVASSIPEEIESDWNALVGDETVFLHTRYFKALGDLGKMLTYRYAWFTREGSLVGIAAFQITIAESSDLSTNLESDSFFSSIANRFLRNKTLAFRVLVLGNSFASGEHGFRFKDSVSGALQPDLLEAAIDMIKKAEKENGNRISATIIKDFYPESFRFADRFSNFRFAEFFVDPNMIMPVKPTWETFEDYLRALTSKYRTKAKAALKRSSKLEIRELTVEDIDSLQEDLLKLYKQVYERADFKLGRLDAESFFNLKRHLHDCFTLNGYFLENKLVGFQSGFFYNGTLDCHFVGIDYDLNYEHAIYQRMLYEYIRLGIESKVERISFGRTAMEIKSTVGAFPVDMKCYVRHRAKASNTLLRLLFGYIKPSEFNQRIAFKEKELEEIEV